MSIKRVKCNAKKILLKVAEEADITPSRLAKEIGMSRQRVHRIASEGASSLSQEVFDKLEGLYPYGKRAFRRLAKEEE